MQLCIRGMKRINRPSPTVLSLFRVEAIEALTWPALPPCCFSLDWPAGDQYGVSPTPYALIRANRTIEFFSSSVAAVRSVAI